MLSEMQKWVHGGGLESGFSYGDFLMHLPSAESRNVGHRHYVVPAAPPAMERQATIVDPSVPTSVANGRASFARVAETVEPVSYSVGRFQVANVTVRQAEPRDAIPAPDTRSIS